MNSGLDQSWSSGQSWQQAQHSSEPLNPPNFGGYPGPAALPHESLTSRQTYPLPEPYPVPDDDTREEGELSEGEFEDLYEPKPAERDVHAAPNRPLSYLSDHDASNEASGNSDSGLYSGGDEMESANVVAGPSASCPAGEQSYPPPFRTISCGTDGINAPRSRSIRIILAISVAARNSQWKPRV
jgi:hypothetical protein